MDAIKKNIKFAILAGILFTLLGCGQNKASKISANADDNSDVAKEEWRPLKDDGVKPVTSPSASPSSSPGKVEFRYRRGDDGTVFVEYRENGNVRVRQLHGLADQYKTDYSGIYKLRNDGSSFKCDLSLPSQQDEEDEEDGVGYWEMIDERSNSNTKTSNNLNEKMNYLRNCTSIPTADSATALYDLYIPSYLLKNNKLTYMSNKETMVDGSNAGKIRASGIMTIGDIVINDANKFRQIYTDFGYPLIDTHGVVAAEVGPLNSIYNAPLLADLELPISINKIGETVTSNEDFGTITYYKKRADSFINTTAFNFKSSEFVRIMIDLDKLISRSERNDYRTFRFSANYGSIGSHLTGNSPPHQSTGFPADWCQQGKIRVIPKSEMGGILNGYNGESFKFTGDSELGRVDISTPIPSTAKYVELTMCDIDGVYLFDVVYRLLLSNTAESNPTYNVFGNGDYEAKTKYPGVSAIRLRNLGECNSIDCVVYRGVDRYNHNSSCTDGEKFTDCLNTANRLTNLENITGYEIKDERIFYATNIYRKKGSASARNVTFKNISDNVSLTIMVNKSKIELRPNETGTIYNLELGANPLYVLTSEASLYGGFIGLQLSKEDGDKKEYFDDMYKTDAGKSGTRCLSYLYSCGWLRTKYKAQNAIGGYIPEAGEGDLASFRVDEFAQIYEESSPSSSPSRDSVDENRDTKTYLTVGKRGTGSGTIRLQVGEGEIQTCSSDKCEYSYPSSTRIQLFATPEQRSVFDEWQGSYGEKNRLLKITTTNSGGTYAAYAKFSKAATEVGYPTEWKWTSTPTSRIYRAFSSTTIQCASTDGVNCGNYSSLDKLPTSGLNPIEFHCSDRQFTDSNGRILRWIPSNWCVGMNRATN